MPPLDLVISFNTGPAFGVFGQFRDQFEEFSNNLNSKTHKLKIGFIFHGDYGDNNLIRRVFLTNKFDQLNKHTLQTIPNTKASLPGCYEHALQMLKHLNWRTNAFKLLIFTGVAGPHDKEFTNRRIDWLKEVNYLRMHLGLYICPIYISSGNYPTETVLKAEGFYKALRDLSYGGIYHHLQQYNRITEVIQTLCYKYIETNREKNLWELEEYYKENSVYTPEIENLFTTTLLRKKKLVPYEQCKYQIVNVNEDISIRLFCKHNNIIYNRINEVFYEHTESEKIQMFKNILVKNKITGKISEAPKSIGAAENNLRILKKPQPSDLNKIFIEAPSANTVLKKGTEFIYSSFKNSLVEQTC